MPSAPPFTSLVADLPSTVPFVGPEALERRDGIRIRSRLGANESVFGPSPVAIAAMAAAATESWKYGDPELHDLKAALARHFGVTPQHIAVAAGIDGLLGLTVRLFVEPGAGVVTSLGAYPTFNYHVTGFGGQLWAVPYRDDREDLDGLVAAVQRQRPVLVYLANPDNPMGSWWPAAAVLRFIEDLPAGTLLCLDEAYGEFVPPDTLPGIDPDHPQIIRFRTFSKAYGLAGLRVGMAIGAPATMAAFDRIRDHFGIGRIAQAGALAALMDTGHLASVIERVAIARQNIATIATANGLSPLPSATNFVTVDCGRDGVFARQVLNALLVRGVFVRMPGVAPLDRCIRIGCGTSADLSLLAEALPGALDDARRRQP